MTVNASRLLERIRDRRAVVGIVGMGYVGLPLALTFAGRGFKVLGFDVEGEKVERLNAGDSYIHHVDGGRLRQAVADGRLAATGDFARLGEPDALLICVPTPLTPERDPDLSFVTGTAERIAAVLRPGQLVVLESTTYPGTTDEVLRQILERSGLACGSDFFLAYSPEREDPGNPRYGTESIPKVVGGVDEASAVLATALYEQIVVRAVRVSKRRLPGSSRSGE